MTHNMPMQLLGYNSQTYVLLCDEDHKNFVPDVLELILNIGVVVVFIAINYWHDPCIDSSKQQFREKTNE